MPNAVRRYYILYLIYAPVRPTFTIRCRSLWRLLERPWRHGDGNGKNINAYDHSIFRHILQLFDRSLTEDTVYLDYPGSPPSPTPYAPGTFNWPIPWYYDNPGGSPVPFYTVNQLLTSDASGNATISKGGVSVTFNVNDATISTGGTW